MFRIRRSTLAALFGLFILVPAFAYGGLVKGKVKGIPENITSFSIEDSSNNIIKESVRIDEENNFSVTLRPGVYTAIAGGTKATIRSSKQPLSGQVLDFKPF